MARNSDDTDQHAPSLLLLAVLLPVVVRVPGGMREETTRCRTPSWPNPALAGPCLLC